MRFVWFDVLKGVAILLVVGYHLLFDLDHFVGLPIDTEAWYWSILALPVLAIFIGGAGASLIFSRANRSYRAFVQKTVKSSLLLLLLAVGLSLVTGFLFPNEVILFGVLHLIGFSRLLALPLVGHAWLMLASGVFVLGATYFVADIHVTTKFFVWLGCVPDNFSSLDYFPLFPWFGIFCIGMLFGHFLLKNRRQREFSCRMGAVTALFAWLGRHTLVIYLVHQPLFMAILWLCGLMRL